MIKNTGIVINPDDESVIIRQYIPEGRACILGIAERVIALDESAAEKELKKIIRDFSARHHNFDIILKRWFEVIRSCIPSDIVLSETRELLIGACFVGEYAYKSTAIFNPSIIVHPDQSVIPKGSLRFIISLRAMGEGHVSSLTFRSGVIDRYGTISIDKTSGLTCTPELRLNALYDKKCFILKLCEIGLKDDRSICMLGSLPDEFTMEQLNDQVNNCNNGQYSLNSNDILDCETMLWLARCNYETAFESDAPLSERVLFPISPSESNGIEDARFVLFKDDDGSRKYYATYTAFDGRTIMPQLIETEDFVHFKMITLNGKAVTDKGMALFPRKINGYYAMISRNDNNNLSLMYSDNIHFWQKTVKIMEPLYPWEFMKIGNCGSPIETERGWLLLTHGVGPMRQYSIGAALLDLKDPSRVIGRLSEPLIHWNENSRSGYVPNVVYSCGSMVHNDMIIIPYGISDQKTTIMLVSLRELLDKLS